MRSSGFEAVSSLTDSMTRLVSRDHLSLLFVSGGPQLLKLLRGIMQHFFFFFQPSLKLYKCFIDWEASNLKLGWGEWAVEGGEERNFLSRQFTKSSTPRPSEKKKIIAVDSSRRFLDVAPYCKVTA